MKNRMLICLCVFFVFGNTALAQRTKEIGLMAGGSYYMGDVNHSKLFYNTQLAYGALYKQSLNDHNSYRMQIVGQKVVGDDADFESGYQKARDHNFETNLYEIGGQYEFNFLPYNPRKYLNTTTYITLGMSVVYIKNTQKIFRPSAIMGIGGKQAVGKRLTVGLEWTYKYAFTDDLDDLSQSQIDKNLSPALNKQRNNNNTNDWYSFVGIVISYNFASVKKWCPAYLRPKK